VAQKSDFSLRAVRIISTPTSGRSRLRRKSKPIHKGRLCPSFYGRTPATAPRYRTRPQSASRLSVLHVLSSESSPHLDLRENPTNDRPNCLQTISIRIDGQFDDNVIIQINHVQSTLPRLRLNRFRPLSVASKKPTMRTRSASHAGIRPDKQHLSAPNSDVKEVLDFDCTRTASRQDEDLVRRKDFLIGRLRLRRRGQCRSDENWALPSRSSIGDTL